MSHCGIDVEKMDTTFANAKSAHNIHWVKCADCHQHGVPKPKATVQRSCNYRRRPLTGSEWGRELIKQRGCVDNQSAIQAEVELPVENDINHFSSPI